MLCLAEVSIGRRALNQGHGHPPPLPRVLLCSSFLGNGKARGEERGPPFLGNRPEDSINPLPALGPGLDPCVGPFGLGKRLPEQDTQFLSPVNQCVSLFPGTRCDAGGPQTARLCPPVGSSTSFSAFSVRPPLTGSVAQLMGLSISLSTGA